MYLLNDMRANAITSKIIYEQISSDQRNLFFRKHCKREHEHFYWKCLLLNEVHSNIIEDADRSYEYPLWNLLIPCS